jgi:protoheme IX farnesyltransferase
VIGGAAGALPPVIGWAIATNSVSIESVILFLIIFIWTPSHFWALSLYKSSDYKKAKIPMLPITSGIRTTKLNILIYSLLMAPVVALPYFFDFGSLFYLTTSSLMTLYYVYLCGALFKEKNNKTSNIIARKIFVYSIFYLFFIFVLILADNLIKY